MSNKNYHIYCDCDSNVKLNQYSNIYKIEEFSP